MSTLKKGDKVSWNTPQGKTEGKIEKKITQDVEFAGKKFNATTEEPKFKVKSSKTGKKAIHKPESLNKK